MRTSHMAMSRSLRLVPRSCSRCRLLDLCRVGPHTSKIHVKSFGRCLTAHLPADGDMRAEVTRRELLHM